MHAEIQGDLELKASARLAMAEAEDKLAKSRRRQVTAAIGDALDERARQSADPLRQALSGGLTFPELLSRVDETVDRLDHREALAVKTRPSNIRLVLLARHQGRSFVEVESEFLGPAASRRGSFVLAARTYDAKSAKRIARLLSRHGVNV